jgi:hypothetical protein
VSGHPNVTVLIGGATADPCRVLLPVEIRHGRSGVDYQPDAPDATFDWDGATPPGLLGDTVAILHTYTTYQSVRDDYATYTDVLAAYPTYGALLAGNRQPVRFAGTITSLDAIEERGVVTRYRVQATGVQAQLGFTPVLLSRPVETDVERVQAIAAAAGVTIGIVGTAGITLAADEIDRDALAALHEVCVNSGGLLWQTPGGAIMYGPLNHREHPPVATVPCGHLLDGVEWRQDLELVINHVVLKWGDPETQDTFRDDTSIDQWGMRHIELATKAADRTQAGVLGALIIARRAWPYWRTPGVLVDMNNDADPTTFAVADLDVSDKILVPVSTDPGPLPAPVVEWLVEGWVETYTAGGHDLQLALTDAARSTTSGVRNWAEQRAGGTWDHWRAGSWLDQLVEVA